MMIFHARGQSLVLTLDGIEETYGEAVERAILGWITRICRADEKRDNQSQRNRPKQLNARHDNFPRPQPVLCKS